MAKKRRTIEDLAAKTQREFLTMGQKIDGLANDMRAGFQVMKEGFDTVREELKGVRHEVKTAGQASRIEYAELRERMGELKPKPKPSSASSKTIEEAGAGEPSRQEATHARVPTVLETIYATKSRPGQSDPAVFLFPRPLPAGSVRHPPPHDKPL